MICSEERLEDVLQQLLVWQHVLYGYLCVVQLAGSYHLHRRRDLARRVDGGDAAFNFFQTWHDFLLFIRSCDIRHHSLDLASGLVVDLTTGECLDHLGVS